MKMLYRFFLAVTGAVSLLFFSLTVMGRFVKGRVSCWWSVCSMKITRLLVAFLVIAVAGKYGIVNRKNGKVMTSAIYDSVDMVSATVFEVKNGDNYGYHFLML